jgi:deoxyribonuclease V
VSVSAYLAHHSRRLTITLGKPLSICLDEPEARPALHPCGSPVHRRAGRDRPDGQDGTDSAASIDVTGGPADLGADAAEAIQLDIAARVHIPVTPVDQPRTVTGLDISYAGDSDRAVAAAVTMDVAGSRVLDEVVVTVTTTFPYRPGLLAFREAPGLLAAIEGLRSPPDLLLCDGQGLAHPRRCGVACHLGVLTGLPAVGCAKNHLTGTHTDPGPHRGDRSPLLDGGEVVGHALRTQDTVRPVFVSPGHLIGVDQATDLVLALSPTYRLPEPLRRADHLSRLALRDREDRR